jgi:hypothetical protein
MGWQAQTHHPGFHGGDELRTVRAAERMGAEALFVIVAEAVAIRIRPRRLTGWAEESRLPQIPQHVAVQVEG